MYLKKAIKKRSKFLIYAGLLRDGVLIYMHDLFQKHKSIQQKNDLVASYVYVYLYGPK